MVKVMDVEKLKSFGFKEEEDNRRQLYLSMKSVGEHSGVGILINPNDCMFYDGELSFHAENLSLKEDLVDRKVYEGLDECVKLDVVFDMLKEGAICYIDSNGKSYKLVEYDN